jgi:hypothetical protein
MMADSKTTNDTYGGRPKKKLFDLFLSQSRRQPALFEAIMNHDIVQGIVRDYISLSKPDSAPNG